MSRYYTYIYKFIGLLECVCFSVQFIDAICDLFEILDLFAILDLFGRAFSRDFIIAFACLDLPAIALSNSLALCNSWSLRKNSNSLKLYNPRFSQQDTQESLAPTTYTEDLQRDARPVFISGERGRECILICFTKHTQKSPCLACILLWGGREGRLQWRFYNRKHFRVSALRSGSYINTNMIDIE